jgi:hypothetical protein
MESDNEAMESDNEAMDGSVAEGVADRRVAEFEDFQRSCRSVAGPSDYVQGDFQRMVAAMSPHEQAAIKYVQVDCVEEARLEKEAFKAKKEARLRQEANKVEKALKVAAAMEAASASDRWEAAAAAERQRRDVALQHEAAARDAEAAIEEAQRVAWETAARERRAVAVLNRGRGGVPWRQDQEGGWADNEQHRDQEAQRARADNRRGRAKGSAWRSV